MVHSLCYHRTIPIQLLSIYHFYLQEREITGIENEEWKWTKSVVEWIYSSSAILNWLCNERWIFTYSTKHQIKWNMWLAHLFYNSYIGSIEMSEWNKCVDMNQDAVNNTKHLYRTHTEFELASLPLFLNRLKRCEWKTKKKYTKINTDKKQETHKLCVQSLSYTPGSKKHTNSSRSRYFHPIHFFHSHFTNQIVNCENAVASQRNDDEWQANAECILFAVCDFIILAKYPGMQNTRSTMPSKCIWKPSHRSSSPSVCMLYVCVFLFKTLNL